MLITFLLTHKLIEIKSEIKSNGVCETQICGKYWNFLDEHLNY